MNMVVRARQLNLTPALQEYAEKKVGKISKVLNDHLIMDVDIELYAERNPSIENSQVAEVTVWTKGPVIRAREAAPDMFAAIDLVSEKLERQVRRFKGKLVDRHNKSADMATLAMAEPSYFEEPVAEPSVVKTKLVEVKPMSTDEAMLQMELLGHDFFVFGDERGDGVNVLYRRKDGDYGLIQPRIG
ncbi:MAG: ribosome-associated translation inhibitor RaiA [Coriobacteriia bacterium]|nr:ribosome-associated translation inhibitor RaiA [Coriobacteriia bacterium]